MTITLANDLHGTTVTLQPKNGRLGPKQIRRAKRALCGGDACPCCGATGARGPNAFWILITTAGEWAVEPNPLAANIAKFRAAIGLTQDQAARTIGRSPQTWSRWERATTDPSLEDLRRLAELFKLTPPQLLHNCTERPKP